MPAEAKTAAGALIVLAQLTLSSAFIAAFIAEPPIKAINHPEGITLRQTWPSAEQEVLRAALLQRETSLRPNINRDLCLA